MKTFIIDTENNISVFPSKREAVAHSTTPFDPFTQEEELSELSANWPTSRLIDIWNSLPGVTAVTKFTNRKTAVERIWKAIQNLALLETTPSAEALGGTDEEGSEAVIEATTLPEVQPSREIAAAEEMGEHARVESPASIMEGVGVAEGATGNDAQEAHVATPEAVVTTRPIRVSKAPRTPRTSTQPNTDGAREGSKAAAILALIERPSGATLAELMEAAGWQAHSVRGFISGALGKRMGLTINSTRREDGVRVYSRAK